MHEIKKELILLRKKILVDQALMVLLTSQMKASIV